MEIFNEKDFGRLVKSSCWAELLALLCLAFV